MFNKINQYIRRAVRNDLYAILEEVSELRSDVNILGKNIYDVTFALSMASKISTKKLASQFDEKKLHDYVVKFQKDLDAIEAQAKKKRAKELTDKVTKQLKKAKKVAKSIGKKA